MRHCEDHTTSRIKDPWPGGEAAGDGVLTLSLRALHLSQAFESFPRNTMLKLRGFKVTEQRPRKIRVIFYAAHVTLEANSAGGLLGRDSTSVWARLN